MGYDHGSYLHDSYCRSIYLEREYIHKMNEATRKLTSLQFALRILGTAIAMIASYIIWYIVDGKTAGVIVFLWVWMFCAFYVLLKFPKLIIVGLISAVTAILVIGYE